jgi:hypothetical protein
MSVVRSPEVTPIMWIMFQECPVSSEECPVSSENGAGTELRGGGHCGARHEKGTMVLTVLPSPQDTRPSRRNSLRTSGTGGSPGKKAPDNQPLGL